MTLIQKLDLVTNRHTAEKMITKLQFTIMVLGVELTPPQRNYGHSF